MKIRISTCVLATYMVLSAIFISSCSIPQSFWPQTVHLTGYYDAYYIVRNGVPFAGDGYREMELARVYLLENDDFGRSLYRYDLYSYMLNESLSIWLVCQYSNEEFAYYYSDECYLILAEDNTPNEEMLEKLKNKNDWNKSINKSKCSAVQLEDRENDMENYYEYPVEDVRNVLFDHLNISDDKTIGFDPLEYKDETQVLITLVYSIENNTEIWHSAHLVLFDTEEMTVLASDTIPLSLIDLNGDINEIGSYIKLFKQENNCY